MASSKSANEAILTRRRCHIDCCCSGSLIRWNSLLQPFLSPPRLLLPFLRLLGEKGGRWFEFAQLDHTLQHCFGLWTHRLCGQANYSIMEGSVASEARYDAKHSCVLAVCVGPNRASLRCLSEASTSNSAELGRLPLTSSNGRLIISRNSARCVSEANGQASSSSVASWCGQPPSNRCAPPQALLPCPDHA